MAHEILLEFLRNHCSLRVQPKEEQVTVMPFQEYLEWVASAVNPNPYILVDRKFDLVVSGTERQHAWGHTAVATFLGSLSFLWPIQIPAEFLNELFTRVVWEKQTGIYEQEFFRNGWFVSTAFERIPTRFCSGDRNVDADEARILAHIGVKKSFDPYDK